MPNINSLTYNGTKSTDLGVFVTGSGSFDAAELDVEKIEVPGRNGDVILPRNRFKNIEITYPAFIPKAFQSNVQSIRNWLRSAKTYARLEDTYDMEHYRLGLASGVQSFEPANRNDASNFEMVFDCKPQRFLKTGETESEVEPQAHTYSGDILNFETVAVDDLTKAELTLSPIQSLNGYDHPWAGGAGKNLAPMTLANMKSRNTTGVWSNNVYTLNNITFTVQQNDTGAVTGILVNNTAPASGNTQFHISSAISASVTASVALTGCPSGGSGSTYELGIPYLGFDTGSGKTGEIPQNSNRIPFIYIMSGYSPSNLLFKPMVRLATDSDATFAPYSNLCPISGHTQATINRTGKNLLKISNVIEDAYIFGDTGRITSIAGANVFWAAVPKNTDVHLKMNNGNRLVMALLNSEPQLLDYGEIVQNSAVQMLEKTINTGDHSYVAIYPNRDQASRPTEIQLEIGSTATDYVPSEAESFTLSLGQTVYGGKIDLVTGEGEITWKSITADGVNVKVTGGYGASGALWLPSIILATADKGQSTSQGNIVSSYLIVPSNVQTTENSVAFGNGGAVIVLHIGTMQGTDGTHGYNSASEVQAAVNSYLQSNPLQIVYKLATPIPLSLTGQQIQTLLGENVVWGDGEVEISYADPYNIENPTLYEARPIFRVVNPGQGDEISVNGQTIEFTTAYTGTIYIDCETMNAFAGWSNMNSYISATSFPVLTPGLNIVTYSGNGECYMTPRWWEL